MTTGKHLEDFEQYLEPDFSAIKACTGLLKSTHTDIDSNELDLLTSIKKVRYALNEVDRRSEEVIRTNPVHLIDSLDDRAKARAKTQDSLGPSIEYLKMSYSRLEKDVLEPHEEALQLQSALSKIHQTSSVLRDVLIFLHLLRQVIGLTSPNSKEDQASPEQTLLALASTHSQLQTTLASNPNLRALRLVKKHESETLTPSRRETLKLMGDLLASNYSGETSKSAHSKFESAQPLLLALHKLSPKDFVSTIDKVVLSRINSSSQGLSKTITSIRNFATALENALQDAQNVLLLQNTLSTTSTGTLSLLSEYISHKKYDSLLDMFWSRVSKAFKRDFETSYTRGGPVGKSLAAHSSSIVQSMQRTLSSDPAAANHGLESMLDSVSILNIKGSK
ncbi:LAFA_0E02344g1_1 [Lachancea sp. 'fantastica']|nr:LAFA_0E02344g1_1 [Lachancea sp. 'fantastica']